MRAVAVAVIVPDVTSAVGRDPLVRATCW